MDMESEDQMWKAIYNKLQTQKSFDPNTDHEIRIQEIDGGFFEKFGSLFREHVENIHNDDKLLHNNNEGDLKKSESTENVLELEAAQNQEQIQTSDSETEEQPEDVLTESVGLNIDELYTEILYEIIHNIGSEVNYEIGQTSLLSYVQDVFKIPSAKHQELLAIAEQKEPPELLINIEVIEAKDLRPKDSNGLSDPFVTLFLNSNTSHRYNTSVKPMTLSPIWEEHFALPITSDFNNDTLCIEVWDFDPAESVKEKFGKIFDVKGVKGVRKLVKEIALTATTGQHENELIGIARIPLKTVPASGMTMWYSLDKKNKVNKQGVIKLRISFSSEKNSQVAEQEHRNLLKLILLHELEMSKVAPFWWSGTFSLQGEAVITQHIAQSGLSPTEIAMCQWVVYTSVHQNHALSFSLFSKLLDSLIKPMQTNAMCEENVKLFWIGVKKLLPSCFSMIRKIRKRGFNDKTTVKQVTQVLNIIKKIETLDIPDINVELFPKNVYHWVTNHDNNIRNVINDAVNRAALEWFNHIMENNVRKDNTDVGKLQYLVQVIQLVRSDLQKAMEFYDKLFQETINFYYARTIYALYQAKICEVIEPEVKEICKSLKRLSFNGLTLNDVDASQPLSEGTSLFEVYLALQRFVMLGKGICPTDYDTFEIRNFYQWFHGGVAQWLDIAVFKALQRIEKAVELDNLVHVDSTLKYSSSAVDTLTIFYQVKVFWQQLNWPDVEGCYTFVAKIIDDICRCCVFYAERMSTRVDGMGITKDVNEQKFEVTNEWCLAINNIEYVRQALQPFTQELGMEEVIQSLAELKSPVEAQRCQHTLDNVIANAIDTVRNEIIELLEIVVGKMVPAMKRLLIEGAELFNQDSNSIDRLMMYVDNNLSTLHNELNEENFNRILEIVWDTLSKILNEIIQSNIEKRRPPSFFLNLHKTLNLMLRSFKTRDNNSNCPDLQRTENLLKIHSMETNDLIHYAQLELCEDFENVTDSPYGEVCVRAKFDGNDLHVEVIHARNLAAMDSNGFSDAFVRIHLLPEEKFTNVSKPKTQTHNKNLFPLFDEKFVIRLSPEQRKIKDGLLLFSCKDKDLLGYNNQYIGEAFIRFRDIPETSTPLSSLEQRYLKLARPTNLSTDAIKALEQRQTEKQAKEFLKKLKQRAGNPTNT